MLTSSRITRVCLALALLAGLVVACGPGAPAPTRTLPLTPSPTALRQPSAASTALAAAPTPRATEEAAPQPTAPSVVVLPDVAGMVGRIRIPALGIDAPVVPVYWHLEERQGQAVGIWDTVDGAAGHHLSSAPLGGEGNCVISGHSRSMDGGVFSGLWELTQGEAVVLAGLDGSEHVYLVREVHKVREVGADLQERYRHAAWMDPTDEPRLTLITCWPDWAYTHRIVVVASPG